MLPHAAFCFPKKEQLLACPEFMRSVFAHREPKYLQFQSTRKLIPRTLGSTVTPGLRDTSGRLRANSWLRNEGEAGAECVPMTQGSWLLFSLFIKSCSPVCSEAGES